MLGSFAGFAVAEDQEFALPPLEERPLVTFALFAYNQEKYIREAVEGAFSQTYEPLEIILSDDCSTDRTFEIMEKMASSYSGPHNVILNKNTENMGICPHVNKIDRLASGKIILHAAGDDISAPHRATTIINYYLKYAQKPSVIVSNALRIDSYGVVIAPLRPNHNHAYWMHTASPQHHQVIGCSLAVSKKLIDYFPPPNPKILAEDTVLYRRAELLSGILYIPERLVQYREHDQGITKSGIGSPERWLAWEEKWCRDTILRYEQLKSDTLYTKAQHYNQYIKPYKHHISREYLKLRVLTGDLKECLLSIMRQTLIEPQNLAALKQFAKILITRYRLRGIHTKS